MQNLTLVSRGVCHPQWLSAFYPADIPQDWRLTYFANEFPACAISLYELTTLGLQWRALDPDLPDGFSCYLELSSPEANKIPEQLSQAVSGILISSEVSVDSACRDKITALNKPIGVIPTTTKKFNAKSGLRPAKLPVSHAPMVAAQISCHVVTANEARNLRQLKTRLINIRKDQTPVNLLLADGGMDIELYRSIFVMMQLLP